MKKTTALILCCVLIFVSGDDSNKDGGSTKINPINISPTNINLKPTIVTQNTTSVPITTESNIADKAAPTDDSILKSKTSTSTSNSTSAGNSTTPSTITSSSTSTTPSTTSASTTTINTTVAFATTNAPSSTTPVPDPVPKKWYVNGTDGHAIVAKMAIQLNIMYNGTKKQNLHQIIDVTDNTNHTEASAQLFTMYNETLKLSWKSPTEGENYVMLHFTRDNKTYALRDVSVLIQPEELPDVPLHDPLMLVHKAEHFKTTLGNSYRCIKLQTFNLTRENDTAVVGQMKVTDLQFQAFKTDNETSFGFAEDCAFDTPDVVPIAVGCVLAGLVVIVLGAYLISRKYSQSQGYLSM